MTKAFKTNITAPAIIKAGGTSTQYLMADGSVTTGGSGVKYTYSSTPPSSPTAGDIWVDSGDGTEYTYVADGDSNQWVELSNAGLPGPSGATGSSGTVIVNSPIVNTGTSTSAVLSLNSAIVPYLNTANTFTVSPQQININSSTNNGLIIKAAASQTADIQQWQDSGSNVLAKVTYDGSALFANGFIAGKNKIINGDFRINQRNFTSTTTSANYGFDRWLFGYSGGTATYSTQLFTAGSAPVAGYEAINYARLATVSQAANNNFTYLYQRIEDVRNLANQTATISFWARAASGTPLVGVSVEQQFGTGGSATVVTPTTPVTISTNWQRYSVTVAIPSIAGKTITSDSSLAIGIMTSVGTTVSASGYPAVGLQNNTIDVWGIQVEAGSIATPFTTATGTIQGELSACQRYYFRSTPGNGAGQYGTGVTSTTTTAYCYINLPVPMRVIPTSVESNALQVIDRVAATAYAASGIGLSDGTSTNFIELSMTIATATAGRFVALRNATTAGYLGFSAEL